MSTQLTISPAFALDSKSADELNSSFAPIHADASKWIEQAQTIRITDASQVREMKLAREYRLALRDVRLTAEKKHRELKESVLRRGKAIDGVKNIILDMIAPAEAHLLEQEKFVERMEVARKEELKKHRESLLYPLGVNSSFFSLGEMPDEQFDALFTSSKLAHEAKIAAVKKSEEDRIAMQKAEAKERERIRLENERLNAEAKARDKAQEIERKAHAAEIEKKRIESEKALEKEREVARKLRDKADQEQRKLQEERNNAQKEKDALALELNKKREAEEAAKENAAKAPDREKLLRFAEELRAVKCPSMTTPFGTEALREAVVKINQVIFTVEKKAKAS